MGISFKLLKKFTFKNRLLVYSFLLSIFPVLILGMISSHIAVRSIQKEVNLNHQHALKEIGNHVDAFLKELDLTSIRIANDLTIEKSLRLGISMDDAETLQTTLDMLETVSKYRSYSDINFNVSLVYNKYRVVYSNVYGLVKFSDYPYYELLRTIKLKYTGSVVIPPHTYPNQNHLLLLRSISTSAIDGMLIMEADAKTLYSYFQALDLGNNSKVMVVDNENRIVASKDMEDIGTRLPSSPYINNSFTISTQKSAFNHWSYIVMTPAEELSKHADNIKHATWTIAACLAAIWTLLAAVGSHRLYIPIQRMTLKLPGANKFNKDGLQALDLYIDHVMETNRHLQNQLTQQLPYIQENLLLQLLRGEITEGDFIEKQAQYGLSLQGESFYICVIEVDQLLHFKQNYDGNDRALVMYALSKTVQEICEACLYCCVTVIPQLGQLALIIGISSEDDNKNSAVCDTMTLIREKVKEYFKFSISAAVSRARKHYRNISESYCEALNLLRYRILMGDNITLTSDMAEDPCYLEQSSRMFVKWQKTIVKSVSEGNIARAESQFVEMVEAIPQYVSDYKPVLGLFTHLLGEIDNLFAEMGYELSGCFTYNIYSHLYTTNSLEELKKWFISEFFASIQQHLEHLNVSTKRKLMQQVLVYIHNHFETDLSLQLVADHFQLSTFQLSRMFKETTNANFMDYLIRYRMNKAKQWLVHTDMPIKEITERLRYTTSQNFSRVFKQVTGMPPGKYREDYRRGGAAANDANQSP